jgi:hypothetical protein
MTVIDFVHKYFHMQSYLILQQHVKCAESETERLLSEVQRSQGLTEVGFQDNVGLYEPMCSDMGMP